MRNRSSPEITSEQYMAGASDYSDAGDTFPRYSTWDDSDAPLSSSHHGHKDVDASREFILKRFLPAAQAMTVTDRSNSSAPTPPLPASQHRSASSVRRYSSSGTRTSSQPGSFESVASSRSKSRYIHEVKQDVTSGFSDEDEEPFSAVCGFPLHLRRLTMLQFRCNSFWMSSRVTGCRGSKARRAPHNVKTAVQDDVSDNSDDLFWSDEEVFEDPVLNDEIIAPTSARSHSMATVHTPNHRGFLGVPRSSNSKEIDQRARQVDRLGTRLTGLTSKTNYMESSRNFSTRPHLDVPCEHLVIPCETAAVSTNIGPFEAAAPSQKSRGSGTKWMDAVASLRPPPSPTMPSESWLSSTLPPDKFLMVKTLSRKPLRSFIPIKPPHKAPSEEDSGLLRQVRQTCSLKEHLHGRFRAQACKRSDYNVIIQRRYDVEVVHSVVAHMVPSMLIKSILARGQQFCSTNLCPMHIGCVGENEQTLYIFTSVSFRGQSSSSSSSSC